MLNNPPDIYPRWMTLKQACFYASIGEKRLIELAKQGIVRGGQDKDSGKKNWIFDRESIDEYRMGQMLSDNARKKALAILKTV